MRRFGEEELDDLALGSAIMGTGGGGNPYIGKLLAKEAIREHGPVTVVDVEELADDDLVVPAAMMGAPTIMLEKLPQGEEIVRAFDALQSYLGRTITHTTLAEAGGINSTMPFVVAARKGIPLVDADLMGRAYPELQMCIPTLYGIKATPMTIADDKGNAAVIETITNRWTERLARSLTVDMGCSSLITLYSMTGKQAKVATIPRTMSLCEELGRLVREARAEHEDPIDAILGRLGGARIFSGKIADIARRTTAGFARAETRLEGMGADAGATMELRSQNEWLVALRDGEVAASTPDLIMVLDTESGEPVPTEEARYGFRVTVIATPSDPRWRSPEGLALVGPRYFGYDVDFVPIEERAASTA